MDQHTSTCPTCELTKTNTEFGKDKWSKTGRNSECKECNRERSRRYYERAGRKKRGHSAARKNAPRPCRTCEETFKPRNAGQIYCSMTCSGIARRIDKRKVQKPARIRNHPRKEVQLSSKPCSTCGDMFAPHREDHVNCSPECTDKARRIRESHKNNKRRAWIQFTQLEPIDPHDIYERDSWTCWICNKPIDPELKWPHPESVSLDHVRPLSWGGAHTADNLAASHLSCNQARGARGEMDAEALAFRAKATTAYKEMFGLWGEWFPSETHEGLLVSMDGEVYNTMTRRKSKRSTFVNGKRVRVDHVVANHFIGPSPGDDFYLRHLNGEPNDNRPDNLEWSLTSESVERQTECPRGHALEGANIVGVNGCRCCGRAEVVRRGGREVPEERVKAIADGYYREMLEANSKEWSPIPGLDGYSASRCGLIRKDKTGRLIKGSLSAGGKRHVFNANGRKVRFDRSVMAAYGIAPPSDDSYPIHLDGDATNHSLENLAWAWPGSEWERARACA